MGLNGISRRRITTKCTILWLITHAEGAFVVVAPQDRYLNWRAGNQSLPLEIGGRHGQKPTCLSHTSSHSPYIAAMRRNYPSVFVISYYLFPYSTCIYTYHINLCCIYTYNSDESRIGVYITISQYLMYARG